MNLRVSADEFEEMIASAIARIPASVQAKLENVVFLAADEPSAFQRDELELGDDDLLGLFEGPTRGQERTIGSHLPATITIFRLPLLACARNRRELEQEIADTVWHEVAHYLGLDEADVQHEEAKSERAADAESV